MRELFGLRVWHDDDLAHLDADLLGDLIDAAKRYEADVEKANREAKRG